MIYSYNNTEYRANRKRTARKALASVIVLTAFIVLSFALCGNWMSSDITITNNENFMLYTSTLVLTIIGVMATGFIFLSETIRKIQENDEEYSAVAPSVKRKIYSQLHIALVLACIILLCTSVLFYLFDDDFKDVPRWFVFVRTALMASTGGLFVYIICLIDDMMNIDEKLVEAAEENLVRIQKMLDSRGSFIRLNSKEYEEFVSDDAGSILKPRLGTAADMDSDLVLCIRGKDSYARNPDTFKKADVVAVGNVLDDFDSRDILRVFKDVEKILCRISDVSGGSISRLNMRKLESALDYDRDYTSEVGIADDIVEEYFELKDYRNCLILKLDSMEELPSGWMKSSQDGIADDECYAYISSAPDSGPEDSSQKPNMVKDRFLSSMEAPVLLLKFKLLLKLDNKSISGMDLSMFNFSYSRLKGTNLSGSVLRECSFYKSVMESANLSNCDLTSVDLRETDCRGVLMNGSNLVDALTEGADFDGFNLIEARVAGTSFSGCPMSNSDCTHSTVYRCSFTGCNLSESLLDRSKFVKVSFEGSNMSNDSFRDCNMSECRITDCMYNNSVFTGSVFNNTHVSSCQFTNSKLDSADMMSAFLVGDNFSNSVMFGTNYTGSQLIGVRFASAQMAESNFTRTSIGSTMSDADRDVNMVNHIVLEKDKGVERKMHRFKLDGSGPNAMELPHVPGDEMSMFDYTIMSNSRFVDSDLYCSSFRFSTMAQCLFNKTSVDYCVFDTTCLDGSLVTGSKFRHSLFYMVDLTECKFVSVEFEDSDFDDCVFDCTLSKVVFRRCSFRSPATAGAIIHGCTFESVRNLDVSVFSDCDVRDLRMIDCILADGTVVDDRTFRDGKELIREFQD